MVLIFLVLPVTPFVGVWIETSDLNRWTYDNGSHPSWVCGLKQKSTVNTNMSVMSHPSWVCGLKPAVRVPMDADFGSHPSWVCGLKLKTMKTHNI